MSEDEKKDPFKKTYAEDLKETFQGLFIFIAIGLLVWGILELFDNGAPKNNYRTGPTKEDYKRWEKEYREYGGKDPNVDVSVQYGGR